MQMIDDLRKDERAGAIEAAGQRRREATDRSRRIVAGIAGAVLLPGVWCVRFECQEQLQLAIIDATPIPESKS